MKNLPELRTPTPDFVREYAAQFDTEEIATETALTKLFSAFPRNIEIADVLLKVSAINDLYRTNIYNTYAVAEQILARNIDPLLSKNDLGVVDVVARVMLGDKPRRLYSFATKYCSFHKPDVYAIFDGLVERLLCAYRDTRQFATFRTEDLWDYPRYCEILRTFSSCYGLNGIGPKALDKFLWRYAQEVFPRRNELPRAGVAEAHG